MESKLPTSNERRVYEVVNPSDAITFEATPTEAGVICQILLASMLYVKDAATGDAPGIVNFDGERDAIFRDRERLDSYADAWGSFLCASPGSRLDYKAAIAIAQPECVERFKADWHERHRTSLSDLCSQAWATATRLRDLQVEEA